MSLNYRGKYDPSTNTPFLQDGVGTLDDAYLILFNPSSSFIVTRDFGSGPISCLESYFLAYDGAKWYCVGNSSGSGSGSVTSVDITPGTGISATGGPITSSGSILVSNTLPDQVVTLTPSGTTEITGTYPNFNIFSQGSSGTGTVTSVDAVGSTGISVTGGPITNSGILNILNTLPDRTVTISGNTGISITGSYPDFGITNDSQAFSSGTVTQINTTAPITGGPITNTGTIAIPNSTSLVDGYLSAANFLIFSSKQAALNGSGLVKSNAGTITYVSGASTQFVKGDGSLDSTSYGTGSVTSVALSGSTGITISGGPITNSGTIVVTNSLPDQTVALTASGGTQITGTYPNFNIYTGNIGQINMNDIGSSIPATTYTLCFYAEFGFTINELKIICDSGTCSVAVQIGGVSVTGISAVSVSSSVATGTATAANTVSVGNKVTLVTSSNSSLVNLQASLKYTRT